VLITANTHGLPFTITQNGTPLSDGSDVIPPGACTVVPVYAAADNAGSPKPGGAVLGSAGSWVDSSKVVYSSESGGSVEMRTVQLHYAITGDPSSGATSAVPTSQPGGNYTGNITFTVTA
jgi:hypothetical protein